MNQLLNNIDKIQTTELGVFRIKRNLKLDVDDVVGYLKNYISSSKAIITKKGKNYYITIDNYIITVNASSYTIITAHLIKGRIK